jgi:hypothetical protein
MPLAITGKAVLKLISCPVQQMMASTSRCIPGEHEQMPPNLTNDDMSAYRLSFVFQCA